MRTKLFFLGILFSAYSFSQQESDFVTIDISGGVKITGYTGTVKDVTIPSTIGGKDVISIGEKTFPTHFLTGLNLPSTIDTIGAQSCQWGKFDSLYIPEGVKYIDDYAFSAGELTKVIIPNTVDFIGKFAFVQNNIESINISENLTFISDFAFAHNQLSSIVVPDNVSSFGENAFYNNKIVDITMPDYITHIGRTAFNRNMIETINGENSNGIFFKRKSDGSIDSTVIVSYGGTAKIIDFIPNTVDRIGDQAFYQDSLTNIIIPSCVKVIENRAFASNMLTDIVLPETLDSIGSQAFGSNHSLWQITIKHLDTLSISLDDFRGTKMAASSAVILVYSEDVKTHYEKSTWGAFGATIKAISSGVDFTITDNQLNPIIGAEVSINGETFATNENGKVFINLFPDNYSFSIAAQNYLGAEGTVGVEFESDTSKSITLQSVANSIDNQPESFVKVYPNPVTNILTIESNKFNLVEMLDLKGSVILKKYFDDTVQLDISNCQNGIYILRLIGVNRTTLYKIVKV